MIAEDQDRVIGCGPGGVLVGRATAHVVGEPMLGGLRGVGEIGQSGVDWHLLFGVQRLLLAIGGS